MPKLDLSNDLMDGIFGDSQDDLTVIKIEAPDNAEIARAMRQMDREIKTATSRPSNDHPRSPRRRK